MREVLLRPLTEELLQRLLATAVTDADPVEVMPPIAGPPGWTQTRRQAFLDFHRSRSVGCPDPVEHTYAVVVSGDVVGAARLQPADDGVEVGVWLGRAHRGLGIGRAIIEQLRSLATAAGAARLTANTTSQNVAAQRLLAQAGADLRIDGDEVAAALDLR